MLSLRRTFLSPDYANRQERCSKTAGKSAASIGKVETLEAAKQHFRKGWEAVKAPEGLISNPRFGRSAFRQIKLLKSGTG